MKTIMPTWPQFKLMMQFFIASIISLASFVGAWKYLGLPVFATETFVHITVEGAVNDFTKKFTFVSDENRQVKSQLTATRLQLNKLTRQGLEAEKYRLTTISKTDNSFDVIQRLRSIEEELEDANDERKRLLGPSN